MKFIVGIDPGLSGAIAFYEPATGGLSVCDIPTIKAGTANKRIIDENQLALLMDTWAADIKHAFIEQVGAMPGQGVTSMFSFGTTYGILRMALAAHFVPRTFVTPQKWKKNLSVPAAKDGARARANQLLPRHTNLWPLVKHDGRAEAALIALYGSQQGGLNA